MRGPRGTSEVLYSASHLGVLTVMPKESAPPSFIARTIIRRANPKLILDCTS